LDAQAEGVGDLFGGEAGGEEAGDGVALERGAGEVAEFAELPGVALDRAFGDAHRFRDVGLREAGEDVAADFFGAGEQARGE
jgi:hypothetical protein